MTGTDEVLLLLHPEQPLLLVGTDGAPPRVGADRVWPLGLELPAGPGAPRVTVALARGPGTPAGARWSDRPPSGWPERLAGFAARVLAEDAGRAPVPDLRRPWMRRGWWPHATGWCDAALASGAAGPGVRRSADLEPAEHWPTSSVARVPTTGAACWFKAVPPYFAREAAVLAVLGETVPGRVPRLLATERMPDGGALLLIADAGLLPDDVDDDERAGLAALLAGLQADTLPALDRLAAAGTADRSPAALAADLRRAVHDGVTPGLLDGPERAALVAAVPAVTAGLERLAEDVAVLPAVLGHGDFHAWNVLQDPAGGPGRVVIDWTDASTGPPGLDLAALHPWEATPDARAQARERYVTTLAERTGRPAAVVDRAVRAAGTAARVVQVLAHEEIVAATEPDLRWQYARWAAHWLRDLAGLPARELIPPSS